MSGHLFRGDYCIQCGARVTWRDDPGGDCPAAPVIKIVAHSGEDGS